MRLTLTLALILAAVPATAAERRYDVAPFDKVLLRGSTDVEVATGRAVSVRAEGDAAQLERLEIVSRGGELSIGMKQGSWSYGWTKPVKVFVTVPALSAAQISGSGDLKIDRVVARGFTGALSGSGDLRLGTVNVADLSLSLTGSGDIYAAGRCGSGRYDLRGSGDIHARDLACRTLNAGLVGSGDIDGRASASAALELRGSGDIRIQGGARCTQVKRGSGDISCG